MRSWFLSVSDVFAFILIESGRIDDVDAGFDCELAHEAKDAGTASETQS